MSSIVSIDARNYDISMGRGFVTFAPGGGMKGNVFLNGNVGIGKTNPTSALDVSGVMKTNLIDTQNFDVSMGRGFVTFAQGGGMKGNVFLNGNIGIGTSSPNSRLDVNGAISTSGSITASGSIATNGLISSDGVISSKSSLIAESSTANTGHVRVYAQASANYIQSGLTATSGSAAPLYFTDVFAANRWMTITATGNVGIGTTAPRTALDVVGSASAYNIPKRWQSDILIGGNYTGGLRYYLLGTLKDNAANDNYGTMNIQGTLGGFTNGSISVIDAMITTRGGLKTSGLLKYYGSNGDDICDIVVYYTGTGTTTGPQYFVYLKTNIQLSATVFLYFDLAVTTGFNSTSQTINAVWIAEPSNTFITTTPTGTNVITSLIASIGNDLTIDTNGNVGIGTITPAATLDVTGLIQGSIAGASSQGQIIRNTTGEGAGWNSRIFVVPYLGTGGYSHLSTAGDVGIFWGAITGKNGNLVIGAHSSAAAGGLKIMADGKVGIGTTAPEQLLEVSSTGVGNNSQVNITSTASASSTTNTSTLNLKIKGAGGGMVENKIVSAYSSLDAGQYVIQLKPWDASILNVFSSGKVGIGTTTPAYTLDVSGGFRTTGALELAKSTAFPNTYIEVSSRLFDFHTGATLIDYDSRIIASGGTGVTGGGTIEIYGTNIGLRGDVGIGTSTPVSALDVSGYIKTNVGVVFGSGGDFSIEKSATSKTLLIKHVSSPHTPICFYNNFPGGTTRVGIDVLAPAVQLDLSTDGARKLTTNTWTTGSDRRIKENITDADLDLCYSISKNLKLRRFKWKDYIGYEEDKYVVGYIAQEVQEVFPKSVTVSKTTLKKENEDGEIVEEEIEDFLSLNVDQIQKTLHGAIQKLMNVTEQQQTQIEQLQQRIQALENN